MQLEVHVWSDIACPWCYVGKKRLAVAAEACGVELALVWHSFELDPRPIASQKSGDYVERLATKYGRTRIQAQGMIDNMQRIGLEEGVAFDLSGAIFANTFDAHRLLKWAHAEHPDQQNTLAAALFDAHLCEGKDLNQASTLVEVACSAGLPADKASAIVLSDDYAKEVREDEQLAREMGVSGVPFFVIGKYGVGGAQRPEAFEKVILRVMEEARLSETPPADGESEPERHESGAFCGVEGC